MKLKVKTRMTFSELHQWAKENNVKSKTFFSSKFVNVHFDENGRVNCTNVGHFDNFIVWREEEISKDTKLELIIRFLGRINNDALYTIEYMSINEYLSRFADTLTTHFYVENEDRELVLIWKDGELV
ncbi:hypothetical protein KXP75_000650 [Staphylococcus pseudintermedius]|uniref:hypothetical protein n=1 Tax=Staphylococcus pseudintermedius TaxID=283734 RepID=UPI00143F4274|nr:hypothetical protein [Staphylococcus pseudintermedius]EGQ3407843.1 hypothetical protein [Staphylococcus pseudintermedius]EHS7170804.1 hypothetical protein [Staphylococcus pseudintermedius]EHT8056069.1 hypothetical protein [Staphylococcus pseudintermedius]EJD8533369.1 hypothetical protein [Staphylococcus pseudintermedius]NKM73733.1 hypothetical protein [Staphylococcus pseudintermedius]